MKRFSLSAAAKRHQSKRGAVLTMLAAAAVAVCLLFNLLLAQIPDSRMQLDITGNRLYTVSQTSLDFLASVGQDVELHVLANRDNVDARIVKFIDSYVSKSSHLSVEYIDPVVFPTALETYGASSNTIVVTCAATGRQETISLDDIIGYDYASYYTTGQATESTFDCEGLLTSAVDGVLRESSLVLCTTSGHGEAALSDTLSKQLKKSHLTVESVNLLTDGGVPDDCDLLLINAPTADLADDEKTMLLDYLQGGGQVVYLMAASLTPLPNFEAVLASWGMTPTDGYIADTARYYQNNAYVVFPVVNTSADTAAGVADDSILLYNSRGLTLAEQGEDSTLTLTAMLSTASSGMNVTESAKTPGTYVLAASAADSATGARLTVYGAASLIDASITDSFTNLSNLTLFLNSVTVGFDEAENISIAPVSLATTYNTVTTGGLWSILFLAVIPLGVLIAGFVRWMRRRRL